MKRIFAAVLATAFVVERAETAVGRNSWEIVSTRLKTKFSNNIRNNFGFLNRTAPETSSAPDKLFVQEGRKLPHVVRLAAEQLGQVVRRHRRARSGGHDDRGRAGEGALERARDAARRPAVTRVERRLPAADLPRREVHLEPRPAE